MTLIRIAGAEQSDLDALIGLRRAWNEENAGGPIPDEQFDRNFEAWWRQEQGRRTFFLAEAEDGGTGEAIGMANVLRYERMPTAGEPRTWWAYVGNVFVLPRYRNAGVGQQLMEALEAWARDNGADHLRLSPSDESRRFYARLGFRPSPVVQLGP